MDDSMVVADEALINRVIGAAIDVHRDLGPGLLESAYELVLAYELNEQGLNVQRQVEIPLRYRGQLLGTAYRADLIVENSLLLELKTVDSLNNLHLAQTLTYLKLLNFRHGLLLNFNALTLKSGLKRVVNKR